MATGLRVIRGPDWSSGNKDGGEGHVGTVVTYGKDQTAEIIWDNGNQTISSIGKCNKFELRVLDNATVGIRHQSITCDECREVGVVGMRWHCTRCDDYDLCSLCYSTGKHDLTHPFTRYETPKSQPVTVPARNKSLKVNALGIFPGATVARGTHWEQNDTDGGRGKRGTVKSLVTPHPKSPRSAVNVKWQSGKFSVCRVGYKGKMDIKYTDEAPGVEYYPQHLPVLEMKLKIMEKGSLHKVNERHKGISCLHVAAYEGKLPIVKLLLENKSDINATDDDGDTPLMIATFRKHTEIAEYLVRAGAQLDNANNKGRTAVHNAAYTGQTTLIYALIGRGSDVNVMDESGDTPLHNAIAKDHTAAAERILTSPKVDLTKTNKRGFNLLHWTTLNGRPGSPTVRSTLSDVTFRRPTNKVTSSTQSLYDFRFNITTIVQGEGDTTDHSKPVARCQTSLRWTNFDGKSSCSAFTLGTETYGKRIGKSEQTARTLFSVPSVPAESKMATGLRVIRGPDWSCGSKDGGEGHVGTVVSYGKDQTAEIIWDNGNQTISSIGKGNKFELRVLDSAPVGIRHQSITCNECNEVGVVGMRWHCTRCDDYNLCSLCYVTGKHDLTHPFRRYDTPKSQPVTVSARNKSLKVNALGIFPGATVARGTHWEQNDTDGGRGKTGTVESLVTPHPKSPRSAVNVKWQSGKISVCRVGYEGKVDIKYTDEAPGVEYYPQHLSVLDDVGAKAPIDITPSETEFKVGDKVCIELDASTLKQIMEARNGWSVGMAKCIGQTGLVTSFADNGDINVEFGKIKYRLVPNVLRKIEPLEVGSVVRITDDMNKVKMLQENHGEWADGMSKVLGKVGRVKKIDADGDAVVLFGRRQWIFNPACCTPVSASELTSKSDSDDDSDDKELTASDLSDNLANALLGMMLMGMRDSARNTGIQHLIKATIDGDVAKVRDIIAQNPQVVNERHKGLSCLHIAAHEGKLPIVKLLLEKKSDINATDDDGDTPLMVATFRKHTEIAEYLVRAGAQLDNTDNKGRTAVHNAAYTGQTTLIHALIGRGCDVNVMDESGDTPLHDAIAKDHIAAAERILTSPKVDLTKTNKRGFNPLHWTAFKGKDLGTFSGQSRSSSSRLVRIVEKILQRNKSIIDSKKEDGFTALHLAAINDHTDIARVLIKQGASVNSKANKGSTPLHLACVECYIEPIQVLISAGANVNAIDNHGDTPLHVTMMQNQGTDMLKALLGQLGQSTDKRAQIATYLLQHGADKGAKNHRGLTPAEICTEDKLKRVLQNFTQISSPPNSSAGNATASGFVEDVLCSSCLRQRANVIILPCSHKTLCRACCQNVRRCPLCGKDANKKIGEDGNRIGNECAIQ
ncbi:E3 ubiquitin-protein ligase MIB2-like [Gigantopelta aegis]|uniref:E3 ubiquitin-protein ligase MIB2-like n=1 Tax=Gigantopelta aegis TaxID=1735272 RepID=UPI001B887EA8|nr:E3 ubiquitin-protein ligase MIB2-like [Gigantopelta aegis]